MTCAAITDNFILVFCLFIADVESEIYLIMCRATKINDSIIMKNYALKLYFHHPHDIYSCSASYCPIILSGVLP